MTPITDPSVISELLTAINSDGYGSEKIDRIISVASVPAPGYEGDDTIVIAQSGIKQLVFLMNETRPEGQTFQSRILNPDDLGDAANFAEYALEDDRDDLDILADRVRNLNPIAPWIEQLRDAMLDSTDLSSFAEGLTDRFADLDATDFRESMTQAMTIASMAGYLEAGNDGNT
jgi:phage gp29-like protein